MYKKIIIIICMFLLVGCTNINTMTLEEIIDSSISTNENLYNTNSKGYKYYLPSGFTLVEDDDFVQVLLSHKTKYYLNVDIISYYYKNSVKDNHAYDDYLYYSFDNGYLKIRDNNDNFFVELCYNYAIIEVEVEESELRYAVSNGIAILKSLKYNDLVIEKYINDNDLESSETLYKIPEPANKNESKNILEYVEEYNN